MKGLLRIFIGFLCVWLCVAPVWAYDSKCLDEKYRESNPEICADGDSGDILFTLLGGAAIAGAGILVGASGGGTPDPGPVGMPTMRAPDMVGWTDPDALFSAMSDAVFVRDADNYHEIRLEYSHARGWTGTGSTIAILDTGDFNYHGPAVAYVAGAIAPGAEILPASIIDSHGDFLPWTQIGEIITATDADIFNASWGIPVSRSVNANTVRDTAHLASIMGSGGMEFINSMNDAARTRDAIFVFAAGNDGAAQSNAISALGRVSADLFRHFVNVVAWDTATGRLADFSNQCGVTMNYCITAPGANIDIGRGFEVDGTSFAAPAVSGAIAVIREMFPYMNAVEITGLLFTTARDLGEIGVDSVYGHGMLDLERATRPVGAALVPIDDIMTPVRDTVVSGAIANALRGTDLQFAFFDSFGRAFQTDLNKQISIRPRGRAIERLRASAKVSARAGNFEFGFKPDTIFESSGLLGAESNTLTTFVGTGHDFNIGNMQFFMSAHVGFLSPGAAPESLVSDFSNITTVSAKFGARYNDWTAEIAIPDAIVAGDMRLHLPVGRAAAGEIQFADARVDLSETPAMEYSVSYKSLTASFIDNPWGPDEFFMMMRGRVNF
ncbi:MAG: S8 family serine peptidase [Rickettsiales bacterium]|jgi:hypothetical protein|nr:S8 family serine peptidase [Rickettsiales bacterium]